MHIWVDADACPLAIREILYRAAERAQVALTLVANKLLSTPRLLWVHALQVPRGEIYTTENIRERLAKRDFMAKLRETGVQTGGPAPLDNTDRKRFPDQLDRFLARKTWVPD